MYDSRNFPQSYDLYRPTLSVSETGVQSRAVPDVATVLAQPCKLFPAPSRAASGPDGVDMDYDAVLLAPAGADLQPAQNGQQPDVIAVSGRRYSVLAVWPLCGLAHGVKALLVETR